MMNIRKIIILSLLAVMLFGCIGTASAGWFDFLGGEDSNEINATIVDQSTTYESEWVVDTGNLGLQKRLPDGKENVMQGYDVKSKITLNLSNASSNQKDKLTNLLKENDNFLYVTVYPAADDSVNITSYAKADFKDDKLTITAGDLIKADILNTLTGGNWAESGEFAISKGNATLKGNETNMTINFK